MHSHSRYARWGMALFLGIWGVAAQNYEIDWHTVDAGGGISTGGVYQVSGTIGQSDANPLPMTGGAYELSGGFWVGWTLPSEDGLPALLIQSTPAGVVISWPSETSGAVLEETSDPSQGTWQPSSVANGSPTWPTEKAMFYRLVR